MDRPDPCAGQHYDHRLGHHRHVDDDAVAAPDALGRERAREACDGIAQFPVGEGCRRRRHWRVVDQRKLIAPTSLDVAVESVVATVQAPTGKPPVERRPGIVEHSLPRFIPIDLRGSLGPEPLRII
jgi:hypothetical protein